MAQRGIPEQRADRRQAGIAGPDAVAPVTLEMVEEGPNEGCVDLGDIEARGRGPGAIRGEREEQAERVAIGSDRLRARLALPDEPVGEEGLEGRREGARAGPRWRQKITSAAASSGAARDTSTSPRG